MYSSEVNGIDAAGVTEFAISDSESSCSDGYGVTRQRLVFIRTDMIYLVTLHILLGYSSVVA